MAGAKVRHFWFFFVELWRSMSPSQHCVMSKAPSLNDCSLFSVQVHHESGGIILGAHANFPGLSFFLKKERKRYALSKIVLTITPTFLVRCVRMNEIFALLE